MGENFASFRGISVTIAVQIVALLAHCMAQAQAESDRYSAEASLSQYFMADRDSEIALARSAAPKSIADSAEVMVLGPGGYTIAVKGSNGFLCIVERSWGAATDDPEFWNPKIRAPICFNPMSRSSVVSLYLLKTTLALAKESRAHISRAIASAWEKKSVRALEPGAMCYMMSKQQYLNDRGMNWHPHIMVFVGGDAAGSWGADLPGSPVIAANDPEERMTIMMVWTGQWSDGTPAPSMSH